MAVKTTFVVQSFDLKRKRLVPGQKDVVPSQSAALKRAESTVPRLPGAAALKIMADDETGELVSAEVLGTFGDIPEDFAESLTGG